MTTQAAAVAAETDENAEQQELEARARRMGWKSKDEFRGPSEKWTEPAPFIAQIEAQAPLRNERLRYLDDRLEKSLRNQVVLNRKLEAQENLIKEQGEYIQKNLGEVVNRGRRAEAGAYERRLADIKAAIKVAGRAADDAEVDRLTDQLSELQAQRPTVPADDDDEVVERKPVVPPKREPTAEEIDAQISPQTKAWIAENEWFESNPEMGAKAIALHGVNVTAGMSEAASLKQVRREIVALFPDKFGNERREAPSSVHTPAPPGGIKPKGKTISDLPPDAQAQLSHFKRIIPGFTDKQYLEEYKW